MLPKFPGAKCSECPLKKARVANFDIMPPDPSVSETPLIFAVGEGPAREEISAGKVWSGNSGRILREGLRAAGLDKYGVVLENAIPCDTRSVKPTKYDDQEAKAEKQENLTKAIECCSARLWNHVDEVQPKLIIVFGREAKNAIVPEITQNIVSLIGEKMKTKEGWDILFSWHPAFILHDEDGERLISEFMYGLNEARLFFEAKPISVAVKIAKTVEEALSFLDILAKGEHVTVDVETTSFFPWDTGLDINPKATEAQEVMAQVNNFTIQSGKFFKLGEILSIQLACNGETSYVFPAALLKSQAFKTAISALLTIKPIQVHNSMFDLPWLMVKLGIRLQAKNDSMLVSYSMDESPFHSLKRLARQELGVEDWSSEISFWRPKRKISFANVPPEVLFPYGGQDVAICDGLTPILMNKQSSNDRKLYENWLMPVSNMLVEMSVRGVAIDLKKMVAVNSELLSQKEKLRAYLNDRWPSLTNPNSHIQVRDILLNGTEEGGFGLDLPEDTTTGKGLLEGYQLDESAKKDVEEWEWELSEFSKSVLGYRSAHKSSSTYIKDVASSLDMALETDGKKVYSFVHPDFQIWATVTGRLVIKHPILTNYSRSNQFAEMLREPFVPRPGYAWVHMDRKQFELRVYGNIMQDSQMIEILSKPGSDGKDRDPHNEAGLRIYGSDYLAMNRKAFGYLRVITKQCVFGRLYNRQPQAIATQLEIPVEEAERICSVIDAFFSQLTDYREWISKMIRDDQAVVNPIGRTRRFPLVTGDNWIRCLNMGCNYMIQSTASDLHLESVYAARLEFPEFEPLFTIHDSVEYEAPLDKMDKLPALEKFLNEYPMKYFPNAKIPFKVDVKISERWPNE